MSRIVAFLLARNGESPVLLGRYDVANVERPGVFPQVAGYDQSIVLLPAETLKRLAAVTFARGLGQG
jgi:hypothetical protein